MANNMISYERFTNLPVNISEYGSTTEEFKISQGEAEPNPMIAPMASPAADSLLAPRTSSDNLRVGSPVAPAVNDYDGFQHEHVLIRDAIKKAESPTTSIMQSMVKNGEVENLSDERKTQILASFAFEHNMNQQLNVQSRWSEFIYANIIGSTKG